MTKTRDLSDFLIEGGADLPLGKPHIVPDVLYPSYVASGTSNKLLDGTTDHSGAFGTEQSDGRKYYYTNIKGSKPIKDPRIGAHFGSQRHKFKSLQLLEQETATHGINVYSVDGREWCRFVDSSGTSISEYGSHGHRIRCSGTSDFIEVVAYISHVNVIDYKTSQNRTYKITVDGGSEGSASSSPSVTTPLISRFVDAGSVENYDINQSLGIHTLKIRATGTTNAGYPAIFYGIELIAQDTTSTANRSKIQIPAQNVVSFGKKFPISATADHYDPFSAKTDGSAWTSPTSGTNNANSAASWPTNIDTAHSLGLDKWVDGSSYYRPYNGGRVVKYVDSTGTIKTAVTMMPPNAKSIKSADVNKKAKNAPNDTYLPTFENETTDIHEDQLHELAKDIHWCEFGNGSANVSASYKDASTLGGSEDIAYVMDDGLTTLSADDVNRSLSGNYHRLLPVGDGDFWYLTFIGTGLCYHSDAAYMPFVQNLPYGTHVLLCYRDGDNAADFSLDGVAMDDISSPNPNYGLVRDFFSFYQPKKPPIPEDACVIADYMLMADFVPQTATSSTTISKGVRRIQNSRDFFYDSPNTASLRMEGSFSSFGGDVYLGNASGNTTIQLPFFARDFVHRGRTATNSATASTYTLDGGNPTSTYTIASGGNKSGTDNTITISQTDGEHGYVSFLGGESATLGVHTMKESSAVASATFAYNGALDIATPIHTSSHYQTFETPFLNELVGGDRNMEQTNLVVSPDGKTWDEVTRDTSYIGSNLLNINKADGTGSVASGVTIIWNKFRGTAFAGAGQGYTTSPIAYYNKNFAIAYDRFICLVAGQYELCVWAIGESGFGGGPGIKVNGSTVAEGHFISGSHAYSGPQVSMQLNRGDYIQFYGGLHNNDSYCGCFIRKLYEN